MAKRLSLEFEPCKKVVIESKLWLLSGGGDKHGRMDTRGFDGRENS